MKFALEPRKEELSSRDAIHKEALDVLKLDRERTPRCSAQNSARSLVPYLSKKQLKTLQQSRISGNDDDPITIPESKAAGLKSI